MYVLTFQQYQLFNRFIVLQHQVIHNLILKQPENHLHGKSPSMNELHLLFAYIINNLFYLAMIPIMTQLPVETTIIEIHRQLRSPGLMMEVVSIIDRLLHQDLWEITDLIRIIITMLREQQRLLKDLTILMIKDHRIIMAVDHQIMMTGSIMKIQNVIHLIHKLIEEKTIHSTVNLQTIKMIQ